MRCWFGRRLLGGVLNGSIDGKEGFLGTEDLFDAGAEFRPGFGGEVEIGARVEQGVLADLIAKPSGLDESVGEIRGTGAAITSGFTGFTDDTTYTGGVFGTNQWMFDYNDTLRGANDNGEATGTSFVTLTVVPEPDVAMLVGGLGLVALLRRRRA